MSRDQNIVEFPVEAKTEIGLEDRQHRALVEAGRLANLSAPDREFQLPASAERLAIDVATLRKMITAILKETEKKKREEKAEAQRHEHRAEKQRAATQRKEEQERKREQQRIEKEAERKSNEKLKVFASLVQLPTIQHETELGKLAKRLGEDTAALREQFSEYLAAERSSGPTSEWHVEPWDEPVATQAVLQELIDKIRRHVTLKPPEALTVALWVLMTWIHEIAQHSPYLVATSAEDSAGKTTLIVEVVGRLAPKAYSVGEPTAAIFRFIDREKPTLIVDDADTLFQRKRDLAHIFNVAWTRGAKIPRHERVNGQTVTVWFDPFCPKAAS